MDEMLELQILLDIIKASPNDPPESVIESVLDRHRETRGWSQGSCNKLRRRVRKIYGLPDWD